MSGCPLFTKLLTPVLVEAAKTALGGKREGGLGVVFRCGYGRPVRGVDTNNLDYEDLSE